MIKENNSTKNRFSFSRLKKSLKFRIENKIFLEQWFLIYNFEDKFGQKSLKNFQKIIPPKDRFWADPFIVFKNNTYYIFFEEYIFHQNKGHIAYFIIDKNEKNTKVTKILEQPFHLSYPFIFEYENELYMIPETQEKRSIQLYKCIDFPEKWEFQKNLLTNIDAVDSTIFNYKNKWWMFSGVKNNEKCDWNDLHIFYTDNPICDNWVPHPMNPITTDIKNSRPAGNIFLENDIIFRPGQISSSEEYGKGIAINRVSILNDKNYEEEIVDKIESWDKNVLGVHTLNRVNGLTVLDAKWKRKK